jgi:cytochrome c-type biogenesis protein CcmE
MQALLQSARSGNSTRLIARTGGIVAAAIVFATLSWAGTVLKLGALIVNPEPYQSKVVRVGGIVADHQLKHIKRWTNNTDRAISPEDKCVQSFTLKDDTGSMQAAYEANCAGAMDLLRNRDRVTLEARFQRAAGRAGLLTVQSVLTKETPYP